MFVRHDVQPASAVSAPFVGHIGSLEAEGVSASITCGYEHGERRILKLSGGTGVNCRSILYI